MIKINLLESVTDRDKTVAALETKVTTPHVRSSVLALVIVGLAVCGMAFDWMGSTHARTAAQAELARQQQIAQQMAEINREMADLEKKTNDVHSSIVR